MKKLTFILGTALIMMSCGEDSQAKVCECSKLYDDSSAAGEKAEEEGGDYVDAKLAFMEKEKEKSEECEKFHKELGDKEFHEMSKNCK